MDSLDSAWNKKTSSLFLTLKEILEHLLSLPLGFLRSRHRIVRSQALLLELFGFLVQSNQFITQALCPVVKKVTRSNGQQQLEYKMVNNREPHC